MTLLILGLLLWSLPHLGKRVVPQFHANLGAAERPMVTALVTLGMVLMVIGYRAAEGAVFWGRNPALVGINNLLMLVSVYLFAAAGMKTALAGKMRHPMLTAVKIWALAHLLVNGDMPSFVLFGGMMAWAVAEVIVINRASAWQRVARPVQGKREAMALLGALLVYGAIAGLHYAAGYPAFG